jgi:single-strand selective monofunctional uracil DNA glycosylase
MLRAMSALETIARNLVQDVRSLRFGLPVTHVYNPLEYAWGPHADYLRRYGGSGKEVVLLGMNPGPFGMAQTGVPFGDVAMVRGWLGIEGPVSRPAPEHPKRPIQGFACARSEVSGTRLWGWARDVFTRPERFFARFYVHNYCPLVFMADSGRNVTPDKLAPAERAALFAACDRALCAVVARLRPARVIGIGAFAHGRAAQALGEDGPVLGRMPHPSPASPVANRGWAAAATAALVAQGVALP